jgi:hypothetical protein
LEAVGGDGRLVGFSVGWVIKWLVGPFFFFSLFKIFFGGTGLNLLARQVLYHLNHSTISFLL